MPMEKLKKLLLVLIAPIIVLIISAILSAIYPDFGWLIILLYLAIVLLMNTIMIFRCPERIAFANQGWMIAGALFACIATYDACKDYEVVFEIMALFMLFFNLLFVCLPSIIKSSKKKNGK